MGQPESPNEILPFLLSSRLSLPVSTKMPYTRPGWTLLQSLELRVGAIEYLRVLERGTCPLQFFRTWWVYWHSAYGIPDPEDWSDVIDYSAYIADYRQRVLRTIRWYACLGRHVPTTSMGRVARIRIIRRRLIFDLAWYRAGGTDVFAVRPEPYETWWFQDTLRGYTNMGLRGHT
ncbi:hypothetical protein FA13DRAFT_1796155 [Coprinellus micaceus]|uniref:Uncharacterized protein n=1 Tax=Coprinellus micaceus TaxID=71717 RepID=A0A4Y7SVE8_COPMI|nr:hypothetical protein FA13DRAFT_1796155 [Coprinellus micaceus]